VSYARSLFCPSAHTDAVCEGYAERMLVVVCCFLCIVYVPGSEV